MAAPLGSRPVRAAIVNDYELVTAGVAALVEPYPDRVVVTELDAGLTVASKDVDVILFDDFGNVPGVGVDLEGLVATGAPVVVFSWSRHPDRVSRAVELGAAGYLSKGVGGEEIVAAIEAAARGGSIHPPAYDVPAGAVRADSSVLLDARRDPVLEGDWPGRAFGLTAREADVIALITQGLSNQEIADRSFLSINSVKTYIRTGYRKIGVSRRAQAVGWGIQHGFLPDRSRLQSQP